MHCYFNPSKGVAYDIYLQEIADETLTVGLGHNSPMNNQTEKC